MWDKKGYVKANHKRMSNFLLTYRKTGLVTSSQLVPKSIFMEKNCNRFAKNCRNKSPQILISLSVRVVSRNLRGHLKEATIHHRCSQT